MDQSKGFVQEEKEHIVCKLKKTLYGLKQLLRTWYHSIDLFSINEGFNRTQANHSLYVNKRVVSCWW